jgi:WD40 repeat protein
MRPAFLFVLALISASLLCAQPTSLSGPVEAITFDAPTRSLRAVNGFPGTASFGPALLDSLDFASVAPRQTYGVVFEGGKCLFVSGLGSKTIANAVIAGVTERPDGVVWSGDGSLAILYSRNAGWFQTITGFPGDPTAGALVDVSSLGGTLTAVAVDTPGKQIVVAVSGDNGGVYQTSGGQFTRLASMTKPISLSFSSDGQTLYALDAATAQVTAVSLGNHGLQILALPGITNPIAIQSVEDSQNSQQLYVAGGSDRIVRILDVASQQILADVPLNFQPTGLDPFGSGSFVLAFRSQSANPLWLFAATPQPGAYFVPAIQLLRPVHGSAVIAGRTR